MILLTALQNLTGITAHQLVAPLFLAAGVLFVLLIVLLVVLLKRLNQALRRKIFRSKSLMTENEQEFFGRLKRALPEYSVFPQVAMGGLIDTTLSKDDPEFWKVRNRFAQKICDFVISTQNGSSVIAVVELDDRTHDAEKDAERDAMLRQAGLRTVRFQSAAKPDEAQIRKQILAP